MPIYEFMCESCGNEFEQIQSFSESKLPHCPRCASGQVHRRMGRPAIHFKGSGWYITDSKKSAERSSAGGSSESKVEKSETKSETKSESKSDTPAPAPAAPTTPAAAD
jgi:putative FmdB family regulatory protein